MNKRDPSSKSETEVDSPKGSQRLTSSLGRPYAAIKRAIHSWGSLYTRSAISALLIVVAVALLIALAMRVAAPQPVIVVAPFDVPSTSPEGISVSGKTIAALVLDELQSINREVQLFEGPTEAGGELSDRTLFVRSEQDELESYFTSVSAPDTVSLGLEIGGLSFDRIVAEWDRIRQRQIRVSGNLLHSSEELFFRVQLQGKPSWIAGPYPHDVGGLRTACREIAFHDMQLSRGLFIHGVVSILAVPSALCLSWSPLHS